MRGTNPNGEVSLNNADCTLPLSCPSEEREALHVSGGAISPLRRLQPAVPKAFHTEPGVLGPAGQHASGVSQRTMQVYTCDDLCNL